MHRICTKTSLHWFQKFFLKQKNEKLGSAEVLDANTVVSKKVQVSYVLSNACVSQVWFG